MKKITSLQADILILVVAFIMGVTFIVLKQTLAAIRPFSFMVIRFSIAFLFLLVVFRPGKAILDKRTLKGGLAIGLILFAGYTFQITCLEYTTASNASFITGMSVILVPFFNTILYKQPPSFYGLVGALSALLGLGMMSIQSNFALQLGDVLAFLCSCFFALHIILINHYTERLNPTHLSILQIGAVAVLSGIAAAVHPQEYWPAIWGHEIWIALAVTAIPATCLVILVLNWVIKYTSPTRTAIILSSEPVFGALAAWYIGGEVLSPRGMAGAAFILLGILLVRLKGEKAALQELAPEE